MRRLMLCCVVLGMLLPSLGQAAYQNPTVVSNTITTSGWTKLLFRFTGNAGEPAVERDYTVEPSTTATALRNWIDDTIAQLDLVQTTRALPSLQPGQTVPRLARTVTPPTAKQIWRDKLNRYLQAKRDIADAALSVGAADLAAMKADLEATYQSGFLD